MAGSREGGTIPEVRIPHNRPCFGPEEEEAAARVLRSGWIAAGPECEAFEREVAGFAARKLPGVAASSGTGALHLALAALDVGLGHEVILPSYVCSAVLDAVAWCGATPVPADVDPSDFNLTAAGVKPLLTPQTRAIILPHTFGYPADLEGVAALGIPVIEDCAQAIGSSSAGKPGGSQGLISVFSFNATKPLTCGQGGMAFSDDADLLNRMRDLREYDRRPSWQARFHYGMNDLAAAIGRVQLAKFPGWVERRRAIARRYRQTFGSLSQGDKEGLAGWRFQEARPDAQPLPYRFVIRTGKPYGELQEHFERAGIETIPPLAPFQLLHRYLALEEAHFPQTAEIGRTALSLPLYPALTDEQVDRVCQAIAQLR